MHKTWRSTRSKIKPNRDYLHNKAPKLDKSDKTNRKSTQKITIYNSLEWRRDFRTVVALLSCHTLLLIIASNDTEEFNKLPWYFVTLAFTCIVEISLLLLPDFHLIDLQFLVGWKKKMKRVNKEMRKRELRSKNCSN
jgi:hypothetical protein